ncbi:hypothetical protein X975_25662, partial [Stegodyphus mimosarum]
MDSPHDSEKEKTLSFDPTPLPLANSKSIQNYLNGSTLCISRNPTPTSESKRRRRLSHVIPPHKKYRGESDLIWKSLEKHFQKAVIVIPFPTRSHTKGGFFSDQSIGKLRLDETFERVVNALNGKARNSLKNIKKISLQITLRT